MDILIAHEVAEWLLWLRETDPGTAGQVDEALAALRAGGTSLGPPLVVPLEAPPGRRVRTSTTPTSGSSRCSRVYAGPRPR
jgi:hypothetical protein